MRLLHNLLPATSYQHYRMGRSLQNGGRGANAARERIATKYDGNCRTRTPHYSAGAKRWRLGDTALWQHLSATLTHSRISNSLSSAPHLSACAASRSHLWRSAASVYLRWHHIQRISLTLHNLRGLNLTVASPTAHDMTRRDVGGRRDCPPPTRARGRRQLGAARGEIWKTLSIACNSAWRSGISRRQLA